ncbi:hypothetical protein [Variovorax paradoxus]|uniref:Uncharacterized protein n=1 Tax=Variovorax paradoxus (strain EPS) TaxID=595537 RepID=E6V9U7_VARPE|nr:hypothetical protein [Variovorax paradoxus]ADU36235.1 hypothetical protein Varpa_2027 [Variovorax paradoxus EPS]
MAGFKLNLRIDQGATFNQLATWRTGKRPGVPVDLTGCTARMQIREKLAAPSVLVDLTTENGGILLGGSTGAITMRIEAAVTAAYAWRSGIYDLEIIFADDTVRRLMHGSVSVSPEVTR